MLSITLCHAQAWIDELTPSPPKSSKQNTAQLFGGIAMQAVGIGIFAGSAYLLVLEPELGEIPVYGLTFGAGFTFVGSGLIIRSVKNMIFTRRAINDMKKEQRKNDVSVIIGPTKYGVGITCTF